MKVQYQAVGYCAKCGSVFKLLDKDEPTPPHLQRSGAVCDVSLPLVRVRRRAVTTVKDKRSPHRQPTESAQDAMARAPKAKKKPKKKQKTGKKLSKSEARLAKKQASIETYMRTVRRGRAIDGEPTKSVQTLSGGIPTLGRR